MRRQTAIQLLDVVILLVMGLVVVNYLPVFFDARFLVENRSHEAVAVRASWLDQADDIGSLAPSARHEFRVNGEAAMRFTVIFPDGRETTSSEIYFSSGMTVDVIISDTGVALEYAAGSR